MGYKKLDEVMELLTDELDGFNKAIDRLEKLTENVDNVKIEASTWKIQELISNHLEKERDFKKNIGRDILDISHNVSRARIIPKSLVRMLVGIWGISLVSVCYLGFKLAHMETAKERAFEEGGQEVIKSLKAYFDKNPELYQSYEEWMMGRDSIKTDK